MGTTKRRRSGEQDELGGLAEDQLGTRLREVGWNRFTPVKDLGEDFHVQIFDEGETTGLQFYVQVKGTRGSKPGRAKLRGEVIEYPVEVKHLAHWEVQTSLVVFVVWDVETKQGCWETVPRLIEALDKKGKGWRKKGKVKVAVPVAQRTDDEGMLRMRRAVGKYVEPLVPKEGTFRMKFSFPATEEGQARAEAFKRAIDEGELITIENAYIKDFQYPLWHQRLYGPSEGPIEVTLGPTKPRVKEISLRLEVESESGYAAIPNVVLRAAKNGLSRKTFESTGAPLHAVLELYSSEDEGRTISLALSKTGVAPTPFEERELVAFFLGLSKPGHRLRVTYRLGKRSVETEIAAPVRPDQAGLLEYFEVIDKLCAIQQRIRRFGAMKLTKGLEKEEIDTIEEIFPIIISGRLERVIDLKFTIDPSTSKDIDAAAANTNPEANAKIKLEERPVRLLGVEIEIGPFVMIVKDTPRFIAEYRATLARARAMCGPARLELRGLPVVLEYTNWLPKTGRSQVLHKIAAGQCGYFTLDQAVEAGYSVETLKIEEHLYDFENGIFRLMYFPPFDHEDLIITWLLTDKKAIFSHDTALALHQLSDLLPTRQHITLPPDYDFPEGVKLPETVEIHRDTIDPSEITWMGPVPFTKPYRTLFDCINDHLSPDLLDQALAQAKSRGMIGRAEAQALQAQRAKSA